MPPSGLTSFIIRGFRVAAPSTENTPITVKDQHNGQTSIGVRNNPVTAGVSKRGLLASGTSTRIVCTGSNLPEEISFGSLVNAGVRFATTRITEGYPAAFEPRTDPVSQGTRIIIRYAGLPSKARLFLPCSSPNHIERSRTAGISAGPHPLGALGGMLLLGRVANADSNGAGDSPRVPFGIHLNGVSEINLQGGAGSVTYEVLDSNSQAFESAQIPTFIALPRDSGQDGTVATSQVTQRRSHGGPGEYDGPDSPLPRRRRRSIARCCAIAWPAKPALDRRCACARVQHHRHAGLLSKIYPRAQRQSGPDELGTRLNTRAAS